MRATPVLWVTLAGFTSGTACALLPCIGVANPCTDRTSHKQGARSSDDLRALAEHFLTKYCQRYKRELRFSEESLELLCGHTWPGNVRELEHCVERAVVLASAPVLSGADMALEQLTSRGPSETATAPDTPSDTVEFSLPVGCSLDQATALFAQRAVDAHDGNRSAAARTLQISRNRLSRLLAPK